MKAAHIKSGQHEVKAFRVSIYKGRKCSGPADAVYTTGSEQTAMHSAYRELATVGDESWARVEELHGFRSARYIEQAGGRGYPRNACIA